MLILGQAIQLEPENVGRDAGDFLDRRPAGCAERIGNAGALRGARQMDVAARPDDRWAAHRRHPDWAAVKPAEQLHLARRQRRHHAVARDKLDGIERRPVTSDSAIVVAGAAVRILKSEMRNVPAGAAAQITDAGIVQMQLRKARILAVASERPLRRRGHGRCVMHGHSSAELTIAR